MSIRDKLKAIGPTEEMRRFGDMAAARAAQKTRDEIIKTGAEVGLKDLSVRAKYKIEIIFGEGRTTMGPNPIVMKVWESGKRLNGGGDELAFWCLNEDGSQGCGKIITAQHIKNGIGFCPHCKMGVNARLIADGRVGVWSTKNLAAVLEQVFRKDLDSDADIYLKYHKTDPRFIAMMKAEGPAVAQRLKGMHIYPLKNILRDTAHGASLSGRFFAFLTS